LTYHSNGEEMVCHQCNARTEVPASCPECLGAQVRFLGVGTQRVMSEAAELFPGVRLLRWDRDVTGSRRAHERILDTFTSHGADILVGTQMIAKGLDLPLVTLVGVINADVGLYLPDFRAGERVFQLLTQVAGRAGRGVQGGRVIVQTYSPDHYVITTAASHDYESFYGLEMAYRKETNNPPYSRLIRLVYANSSEGTCQREAERMARRLQEVKAREGLVGVDVLGPAPAYFGRIRGRYRWQVILRGAEPSKALDEVAMPQGWIVDVDPASVL
jgi:primosomal protein N' (replication factor Y)